jgi:hypothetical protein
MNFKVSRLVKDQKFRGKPDNNSNVRYNLDGIIYGKPGCWLCKVEVRELMVSHQRRPLYRRGRTHCLSKSSSLPWSPAVLLITNVSRHSRSFTFLGPFDGILI